MAKSILVVDDDPSLQRVLTAALSDGGYQPVVASAVTKAESLLADHQPELVLLDLNLPDGSGLDALKNWKKQYPLLPIVVITAQNTVENAIQAMQYGAFDYVTKPFDLDHLYATIAEALANSQRSKADPPEMMIAGTPTPAQETKLVGTSPAMREVYKIIGRTAVSDATTLIVGESGTGKELVARAVHAFSPRANKPFVAVNTTAIPGDLLEAELFGYEKGAFTGAVQPSLGKFREAHGGTLLLDEIGDMPLALQAKLLRVIQERELTPLGGRKAIPIDVRIVAATQTPLEDAVAAGRFRADLFYRIKVVQINLPPLRERRGDIAELCLHFLRNMAARGEIPPKKITPDAIRLLETAPWPGNVRQLENLVRRVALLSPLRDLDSETFRRVGGEFSEVPAPTQGGFAAVVEQHLSHYVQAMHEVGETRVWNDVMRTVESVLLRLALQAAAGNQLRAAELLGINRNTIRKKLTEHNIEPRDFRQAG